MSSNNYFKSIAAVTRLLKHMIERTLIEEQISSVSVTSRPLNEISDTPNNGINLFLYNITPNNIFNNSELPTRDPFGNIYKNSIKLSVNLHYIFSAYCTTDDDLLDQQLLGMIILLLQRYSTMTNAFIKNLIGSEEEDPTNTTTIFNDLNEKNIMERIQDLKISMDTGETNDISKIWTMFSNTPYKASIMYRVSMVLLENEYSITPSIPVIKPQYHIRSNTGLPEITSIEPAILEFSNEPHITLKGKNFSNNMRIMIGLSSERPLNMLPQPILVKPNIIEAIILPEDIQIGKKIVQIISTISMGSPPSLRSLGRSNQAVLEIVPKITNVITPIVSANTELEIQVQPSVSVNDKVKVLIGSFSPIEVQTNIPPDMENTNTIRIENFPSSDEIPPGVYLIRVQINNNMPSIMHIEKDITSPESRAERVTPSITVE